MNTEQFWQIIEQSRSVLSDTDIDGNLESQAAAVRANLSQLTKKEIAGFDEFFHDLSQNLYTWRLWGAAYVIGGGCSDDSFNDFRSWVISLGQEAYEMALKSPDDLGPFSQASSVEDTFFEGLSYLAEDVYDELFDEDMETDYSYLAEPKGEKWDEDELDKMYPKLAKIYA